MKYPLFAAALLGAALSSSPGFADEPPAGTDQPMEILVETPTRTAEKSGKTIADTTVITAKDIRKSHAPDLPTLLRDVVGVEIAQPGGIGKPAGVYLRGSNSDEVLVLVDGVRMDSATLGTTAIDQLMADQIDHIEVVRGNVSSLYGTGAIGGVIQIFTKRGRGAPAANASVGVGSLGTRRVSAGIGGAQGDTDFSVQVSSFKTDGVSALNPVLVPNANPDRDGYRNNSVSASLGHSFNADHRVSASLFGSYGDNQYDSGFGLPTDVNVNKEQMWKLALASDDQISDIWHSKLQVANGVDQYRDFLNGAPTAFFGSPSSLFQTASNQLGWQNTLDVSAGQQLVLGAESLREQVSTDITPGYAVTARTINSVYAGYTGQFGAHELQLNLRQDRNSQYGNVNTWLTGYGYSFNDAWRATASYSTAFKAPTFNDLYYPNYGNPAVRPEHSRNMEAGLHYHAGMQQVDMVYFDNRIADLINPVLVDPVNYIYRALNVDSARISGVELSYDGRFGDTGVKAAWTDQNPHDALTGVQLDRRARVHGSLGVTHHFGKLDAGVEWQHSGTRPDASNTRTLPAYDVFGVTGTYALGKATSLVLRGDNLTNQNNAAAYGYNYLGPTFFVGINYRQ
ncbi:MAG TPA: TonB-dependent receptor [Gallionellaceae bacterium]|nr:TonB-dependent receptor [Gallionellaceae bacterium]